MNRNIVPSVGNFYSDFKMVNNNLVLVSDLEPQATFTLNVTGQKIWNMIINGFDIHKIVDSISTEYTIDYDVIYKDVMKLLQRLWINGFITWPNQNPFISNYRSLIEEPFICEQIWVDKIIGFFNNLKKSDVYVDAFLSDNEFADDIKNARNIYHKNCVLFVIKNNDFLFADILMQLDRVNMICYILHFSLQTSEIASFIIKKFINSAKTDLYKIFSLNDTEKEQLTILFNLPRNCNKKQIEFLHDIGFVQQGILEKESKSGDVVVYRFS